MKVVAIDFDGTVVMHEYPAVGPDVPGAVETMKLMVDRGWKMVLNTMRSGPELDEAVAWFVDRGLPLYGVNENPTQKQWTTSPKVHADIYIDDRNIGMPLVIPETPGTAPYVDWGCIASMLMRSEI